MEEKPPFVPQNEPVAEPDSQIPKELFCMVCKDLLQDAVLIPCCGNSFCDECVRQILLDSDNHECPECHETDVLPSTLLPNRFLRTAVLNFENETGYTRVKKIALVKSSTQNENGESPQLSPDSTVQNQPTHAVSCPLKIEKLTVKEEIVSLKSEISPPSKEQTESVPANTDGDVSDPVISPKQNLGEDTEDIQPGSPLADEPLADLEHQPLPIQAAGQEQYKSVRYDYPSSNRYNQNYRDDYHEHYKEETESSEPKPIRTIETITNIRKAKLFTRPGAIRPTFLNQRPHREDRLDSFNCDRDDYHNRYDRRHHVERNIQRYDRLSLSRYADNEYHRNNERQEGHYDMEYDTHSRLEEQPRRHPERYRVHSHPIHIASTVPVYPVATIPPVPPIIPPALQVFAPQPPPPGASPIDTSHIAAQPPPPGVGPLLPLAVSSDPPAPFSKQLYETEDSHKDAKKIDDRSIDDKIEAFQRKLLKRDRSYSRPRFRSRSWSSDRKRPRTSSRSCSYSSSKSWTRSYSRSSSRSRSSRSWSPLSIRSHSRSYSSRSRSWSNRRSYTRSRSRRRTESRSESRSRAEPRFIRKVESRDRDRSPRPRSRSRSYSPRNFRHPPHRNVTFAGRHTSAGNFAAPQFRASCQSQYSTSAVVSIPARPDYPPNHVHSIHPVQPLRIVEHYPIERQPKCPPSYNEMYHMYDTFPHPRYDREQRPPRCEERQEYQKDYPKQHPEVITYRIPGYIGDRSRDYKPRYRQAREPRKENVRELPQIPEQEIRRIVHTKETVEDSSSKKKDGKAVIRHKKQHHHHESKETKKLESKIMESRPQRRSAVVVPKEEKGSLSSDIIQRAELAILSKPLKPQTRSNSSPDAPSQLKEPELKSVVHSERLASPALQVTISTTKEKRSVHSRKDENISKESSQSQPKRIKFDRSNFSKVDKPSTHRVVSTSSSKVTDRARDTKDKNLDRHDRRRSPLRDTNARKRASSRDQRERDYSTRRTERELDVQYNDERLKYERRYRFAEGKYIHNPCEFISHEGNRPDRRRPVMEAPPQSRVRHYDRDNVQLERSRTIVNRRKCRSRSYDSPESPNAYKKRVRSRTEHIEKPHYQRSTLNHSYSEASENTTRRKYSIKPPEKHGNDFDRIRKVKKDFQDDLKFEPHYDAFSDVEERGGRLKRKSASPENRRNRTRFEKMPIKSSGKDSQKADRSSINSSASSSSNSESDSYDADDLKGSKSKGSKSKGSEAKHKKSKHKKHKHKKKSHKSKGE